MKGEQHLNNPEDFARVHARSKWIGDRIAGLKSCPNDFSCSRYGFIVSKRVGGAVVRNRVKRRMREILRVQPLKPGMDIIVSARPPAADADYETLGASVKSLLARAGLLLKNDKENCPGRD
jgi:ribonuclease P protein component